MLGLVFLAFIYRNLREKKTGMRSLLKGLLFTTGAFLALFLLFLVAFDYNIVTGMVAKYTHNWDYIAAPQFGYLRSLALNLKEFFISMGMPQSIMFFVFCGSLIAGLISVSRKKREGGKGVLAYLMQPGPLLLVSCFFTLLVIDLLGVNRAEITRVWIYMMVFMDMCIAFFMGERESRVTFYTLLACKVFQTAVTIYLVGFVL